MLDVLKKWNFWRKARNRHGIHSPFVYRFLDEALYRKDLRNLPPQKRLLLAAADHFNPLKAMACNSRDSMAEWLRAERPGIRWEATPTDLYICEAPGETLLAFLDREELWENETVVFVGNLRENQESYTYWGLAASHPAVRVILETYPAGLLLFRTQQARQHFRIRI